MRKVLFVAFLALGAVLAALFLSGKVLLSANHLVAFYNPWAVSRDLGWGISVIQKPVGKDDLWIFYPQRTFTIHALKALREVPLWNPYSLTGTYHAGLSESAVFYPLNILFMAMRQIDAWQVLMLLEPVLYFIGTYLFLSSILGVGFPAMFGAGVFAFSRLTVVRMVEGLSVGHTLVWLPFVLWSAELYRRRLRRRYLVLSLLFLVCSLTAGWFQYTAYIAGLGALYALFRGFVTIAGDKPVTWKQRVSALVPFGMFPFVGLFHIYPALTMYLESPRGLQSEHTMLIGHLAPIQHLLTLLFPDYWGNPAVFNYKGTMPFKEPLVSVGIVPLVLAGIPLVVRKPHAILRFLWWVAIAALLVAFDTPIARLLIALPIPIVSTFVPARALVLVVFSLSVFSAYGLQSILVAGEAERSAVLGWVRRFTMVLILASLALWLTYAVARMLPSMEPVLHTMTGLSGSVQLKIAARNTVIPTGIAIVCLGALAYQFRSRTRPASIVGVLVALFLAQVTLEAYKFLPISDRRHVFPDHPVFSYLSRNLGNGRFLAIGEGHMDPGVPLQFLLNSPEGAGSMYIKRYGELVGYALGKGVFSNEVSRIEAFINPKPSDLLTGNDPYAERVLRLTGISQLALVSGDRDYPSATASADGPYAKVWQEGKWEVWRSKQTPLRAFVTSDYVLATGAAALPVMFAIDTPETRVTLERNPGFLPAAATGSATITQMTANTMTLSVKTEQRGVLYVSDAWSGAFRAMVDGNEAPILRANYAFRAVPVEAGAHEVTMAFDLRPWYLSVAASAISFVVFLIVIISLHPKPIRIP